ncbi:hypothetical protein KJN74_00350, partial [Candidatus Bathyarchaeota archaeon]|nr:hypothetical protein [Candidatus Bathyarchaeota archaeon]
YQTIGIHKELAYEIGEMFEKNYDNKLDRADAILNYVQRWTDYGFDEENVIDENGDPQIEWAWNADEMAHMFNENTNLVAIGDCEDMSFLCATIFLAANFDVALVDAPGHVALLIWLPEYDNANYYWDLPNDGREYGWIWIEATGEINPVGWTPPDFSDGNWSDYILGFSEFNIEYSPTNPQEEDDVVVKVQIKSAISTINTVVLKYTISMNSIETQMIKKGTHYEAIIPKQPDGTKVTGVVYVTDNEDLTSEQKFEYIVGNNFEIPPFVFEVGIFLFIIFIIIVILAISG